MSNKTSQDKWLKKIEKDFFSPQVMPCSLMDVLEKLKKADLDEIRRSLNLKGVSGLKKSDLTLLLKEEIVKGIGLLLTSLDHRQLKFLATMAEKKVLPVELPYNVNFMCFYRYMGLVFTATVDGEKSYIMPDEIAAALKEALTEEVYALGRINEEWMTLTQGLLNHYGVLDSNELFEMVKKYAKNELSNKSIFEFVISTASILYEQFYRTEEGLYACYAVINPEEILKELESNQNLSYYHFSYKDVAKAGELDYIEKNLEYKKFFTYLINNYHIDENIADDVVTTVVYDLKNLFNTEEIFADLRQHLQLNRDDLVKSITEHLVQLTSQTRQWVLKGHRPVDLAAPEKPKASPEPKKAAPSMPVNVFASAPATNPFTAPVNVPSQKTAPQKKVGRNAPCPCNSGKKYKFCCGR